MKGLKKTEKNMPRLLLIQPPVEDFYDTDIRLQPLGLCYLKAAVRRFHADFEVLVRDYHQGWGRKTIPLPRELAYLKPYYAFSDKSPFSTFHQYYHFGASYQRIAEEAVESAPDLIGISALFSPYFKEVLRCAEAIKGKIEVPILVGGSHVSCSPCQMLQDPNVDFVVRGEGERPLVEFLSAWKKGRGFRQVPNLGFKENGKTVINPMARNFPFSALDPPDFSDLSASSYLYKRKPITFITTSRGCPHQCSFCSVHLTFGKTHRRRTPESVVQEMELRYQEGYRVFDFEDDNLTADLPSFKKLCGLIEEQFRGRDIELLAMNGISYQNLDKEALESMRTAGFTHLNLALVSVNEQVLRKAGRPHTVSKFMEIVQHAHFLGFSILAHQILGLPGETREGMISTLVFLAKQPLLIGVSIFYLTPGSIVSASFPEMGDEDIFRSRSTAMAIVNSDDEREALFTLFISARILNFLKGLKIAKKTIELSELLASPDLFDPRSQLGLILLKKLLEEKCLYSSAKNRLTPVKKFQDSIFFKLLHDLKWLRTQEGKMIMVSA